MFVRWRVTISLSFDPGAILRKPIEPTSWGHSAAVHRSAQITCGNYGKNARTQANRYNTSDLHM